MTLDLEFAPPALFLAVPLCSCSRLLLISVEKAIKAELALSKDSSRNTPAAVKFCGKFCIRSNHYWGLQILPFIVVTAWLNYRNYVTMHES